IIARLEHPGIVPVHDAGELPDGRFYYAMKLVRGRRLDEEAVRLPELAARLGLFQKTCEAVAFAHAHGVLHRDLKPQNIMVGEFGEVLVMDWGVAKELHSSMPLSRDRSSSLAPCGDPSSSLPLCGEPSSSLPPCGGGLGWGVRPLQAPTSHPNPPPQGG